MTQLAYPPRSAEWPIGDQLNAVSDAVLDDAVEQIFVVPDAYLDLHRRDLSDAPRLFDVAHFHVAQPDAFRQSLVFEGRKRTNGRRQRHARVRRMQLIQVE